MVENVIKRVSSEREEEVYSQRQKSYHLTRHIETFDIHNHRYVKSRNIDLPANGF